MPWEEKVQCKKMWPQNPGNGNYCLLQHFTSRPIYGTYGVQRVTSNHNTLQPFYWPIWLFSHSIYQCHNIYFLLGVCLLFRSNVKIYNKMFDEKSHENQRQQHMRHLLRPIFCILAHFQGRYRDFRQKFLPNFSQISREKMKTKFFFNFFLSKMNKNKS